MRNGKGGRRSRGDVDADDFVDYWATSGLSRDRPTGWEEHPYTLVVGRNIGAHRTVPSLSPSVLMRMASQRP